MKAKTFWIYRFLKNFLHNFSFPTLYIYINTEYWPEYSFNWCKENISGVSFIYVSADVKNHSLLIGLEKHYKSASTAPGARSYHCFIPTCTNELQLKRISANPYHCNFRFGKTKTRISLNIIPGQYYVYMYDDDWSIGIVHLNIKMSISNFRKKAFQIIFLGLWDWMSVGFLSQTSSVKLNLWKLKKILLETTKLHRKNLIKSQILT